MAKMSANEREREKRRLTAHNTRLDEQITNARAEIKKIEEKIARFEATKAENAEWITYLGNAPGTRGGEPNDG
jgi:uncharacterized protein YlxW (UPF0749 family)